MSPSTVYDRTKKTGFMTGPNHPMSRGLESMQRDAPPPPTAGAAPEGDGPPNLRDSGDGAESCGECANFDGRDMCTKYDTNVTPNEVCDSFEEPAGPEEPEEEPEGGEEDGAGMPMSGIPTMTPKALSPLARQAR